MRIQVTGMWNHPSMSTTGTEPDTSRPNHRVKYLVAVAVCITVAIAAVIAVTVDAPGRISRAVSGTPLENLFSSQRLESELDVVRARLGDLPMRRVDVTTNLISVEAVAADGQLHKSWVRDGEVEDVDSIADLPAGEIQLVSYLFRQKQPLSVAVWIRHDPVSSVLHFDPRGGSTVVREESIETDEHTSSFGGCWC